MTKKYEEEMRIVDLAADGPWFVAGWTDDDGHYYIEDGRSEGLYPIRCEGNEARYIATFNPTRVRELVEAEQERDELAASVERLREAVGHEAEIRKQELSQLGSSPMMENETVTSREMRVYDMEIGIKKLLHLLAETSAQPLQHIKAQVEAEVVGRCVEVCRVEVESRGYKFGESVYEDKSMVEMRAGNYDKIGTRITEMPRKYKDQ